MRLTKGGEAAVAAAADREKWFWHADSKPVCLPLAPLPPQPLAPTHPFLRPYARCFVLACELARTEIRDVSRL